LRALAEWRAGGGAAYCRNCRELNAPCARGERGSNGKRCPKHDRAPHSVEGSLALRIGFTPGVVSRAGMAGVVVGVNYEAARALAPRDCDREILMQLVTWVEDGMIAGFEKISSG
jgi:hypothetical protein